MASSSYCDFCSPIVHFIEECKREHFSDTDKVLDQLFSSLLLDLALDVLSGSSPLHQLPYPPQSLAALALDPQLAPPSPLRVRIQNIYSITWNYYC